MTVTGQPCPGKKFHDKHRNGKLLKTRKKKNVKNKETNILLVPLEEHVALMYGISAHLDNQVANAI